MLGDFRFLTEVGKCQYCIQRSFRAAMIFWIAAIFSLGTIGAGKLSSILIFVSVGSTSLWLLHVLVFALRAQRRHDEARRNALSVFVKAFAFIVIASSISGAFAQVNDLPNGYQLSSCCTKGCGGACCRCGKASGYLSDCATSCAIGLSELKAATALEIEQAFTVQGRLVHAQKGTPLANQEIAIMAPGGKQYVAKTANDGTFSILVGSGSSTATVSIGDQHSVSKEELDADEDVTFLLQLKKA